ncbi:unnamed protein product [Ambrosiozyma monospora]|uniref:Unnamed protein product n=1 Tax=Ambrosiozyma monospora TaxID=43982 RepID=A0ACB5U9X1_AMBMO|nr:unnamed protein product [Ambrosiozyma monospora]
MKLQQNLKVTRSLNTRKRWEEESKKISREVDDERKRAEAKEKEISEERRRITSEVKTTIKRVNKLERKNNNNHNNSNDPNCTSQILTTKHKTTIDSSKVILYKIPIHISNNRLNIMKKKLEKQSSNSNRESFPSTFQ